MTAERSTDERAPEVALEGRSRLLRVVLAVVIAVALVVLAAVLVGPQPKSADAGFPDRPPPLALPSDEPKDSLLARAAAQLAEGKLPAARLAFTDVVAGDQDGVAGQVGLVLSRWRSTGPESVERDLRQLTLEYPESALAVLHLGIVQALLGDPRSARESLRSALEIGRAGRDATSLRMAMLADDLLHPAAFQGTLPILVRPEEVGEAQRPALRTLAAAVARGDRRAVVGAARTLDRSGDPMAQVATAAASFDKGDPDVAVDRLAELARSSGAPEARDRALLLGALAALWGGGPRAVGCTALKRSAGSSVDAATRRFATPIEVELCR